MAKKVLIVATSCDKLGDTEDPTGCWCARFWLLHSTALRCSERLALRTDFSRSSCLLFSSKYCLQCAYGNNASVCPAYPSRSGFRVAYVSLKLGCFCSSPCPAHAGQRKPTIAQHLRNLHGHAPLLPHCIAVCISAALRMPSQSLQNVPPIAPCTAPACSHRSHRAPLGTRVHTALLAAGRRS